MFGICYGMQTMAHQLGGSVQCSLEREFGYAQIELVDKSPLVEAIEDAVSESGAPLLDVWMSHGDKVEAIPEGFHTVAKPLTALMRQWRTKSVNSTGFSFTLKYAYPSGHAYAGALCQWYLRL